VNSSRVIDGKEIYRWRERASFAAKMLPFGEAMLAFVNNDCHLAGDISMLEWTGKRVPQTDASSFKKMYRRDA